MATALSTLRDKLERSFGELDPITSGTCTGGSTTTVVDTSRDESDDAWQNSYVYITDTTDDLAPEDEERRVSAFANSTGTMTVTPAFSAAVEASDTYEIRDKARKTDYNDAVNHAIECASGCWYDYNRDTTTIIICTDELRYNLPSGIQKILRVDREQVDVEVTGTASSGNTTSLTDSTKSWDTDEWNTDYAVAIYDGTGRCQQATITDTTSDTLTFAAITTAPDSTSKYKIKYIAKEKQSWRPVIHYDWDRDTADQIKFHHVHPDGMSIRLYYVSEPATLSTDAAETDVPAEYIRREGLAYLWEQKAAQLGGDDREFAANMAANWHAKAELYKRQHGYRLDWSRINEEGGARISTGVPDPLGWRS
jgi:hypothetical protein